MALIEHFSKVSPKLLDDVVPKLVSVAVFQKVLQSLLEEAIHIRDLRTIIEVLAAVAPRTQEPAELVAACRIAMGQSIVQQIYGRTAELSVIALNPDIERMLLNAIGGGDADFVLEPGLAEMIFQRAADLSDRQENAGLPPVLLVPDRLRTPLARLLKRVAPRLRVISHAEIPDTSTIRVESVLGAN
jgi:flagellar biosynthesis protein FlhA